MYFVTHVAGRIAHGVARLVRALLDLGQHIRSNLGGFFGPFMSQILAVVHEIPGRILRFIPGCLGVCFQFVRVRGVNNGRQSEYRQRGQTITRKQAVAAVRSRRMEDPKFMDTLLAEREAEKAAEQQRRSAAAAAAVTEGGATVQKAGPEPTKQPRAPQNKEEFARLPLEEKRKILEGATI